jgi:DNA-binding transcriptional LysR family regulator
LNLDLLRSFFAVVEHGSLNRAAEYLHVAQSTLTRQMRALEHEVGGRIFERSTTGVALTASGHALLDGMRPVLARFDAVIEETRGLARGQSSRLRIGYIVSAAAEYLHRALAAMRRRYPEVKVRLIDLSPGEQIEALRRGEIDVAFLGTPARILEREFLVRRVARIRLVVALPETHALAAQPSVRLADLKGELFIGAAERDLPGNNPWLIKLCRRAGFRPRFVLDSESLSHGLSTVVTEGAVALLPEYTRHLAVPGVAFRPLREASARWELLVASQRGRLTAPVRAMLDALPAYRDAGDAAR